MVVGQKVICVDDKFPEWLLKFYTALPKKDVTYVIREVKVGVNHQNDPGEVCVYLVGVNNPKSIVPPFPERGFNSERFRPLEEVQNENQQPDSLYAGAEVNSPAVPETVGA